MALNPNTANLIFASAFGGFVLLGLLLLWYLFKIGFKCAPEPTRSAESVELDLLKEEFKKEKLIVDPSKVIITDKLLGYGKFGAVYAGIVRLVQANGLEIYKSSAIKFCDGQPQACMELLREAKRQSQLKHPHVVEMWGVCMDDKINPLVLMERLDGDNMKNYLQGVREGMHEPLDMAQVLRLAEQMAQAGAYIHDHDHIHRDIAARNIMLTSSNITEADAKLGDFGLAQHMYSQGYYQPKARVTLPIAWIAPEVFKDNKFSKDSDIWMYGVTLWEILTTGETPHENEAVEKIIAKVCCPDPTVRYLPTPEGVPDSLLEIMHSCWELEPSNRPSFQKISELLKNLIYESQQSFSPVLPCGSVTAAYQGQFLPTLNGNSSIYTLHSPSSSNYSQRYHNHQYSGTYSKSSTYSTVSTSNCKVDLTNELCDSCKHHLGNLSINSACGLNSATMNQMEHGGEASTCSQNGIISFHKDENYNSSNFQLGSSKCGNNKQEMHLDAIALHQESSTKNGRSNSSSRKSISQVDSSKCGRTNMQKMQSALPEECIRKNEGSSSIIKHPTTDGETMLRYDELPCRSDKKPGKSPLVNELRYDQLPKPVEVQTEIQIPNINCGHKELKTVEKTCTKDNLGYDILFKNGKSIAFYQNEGFEIND